MRSNWLKVLVLSLVVLGSSFSAFGQATNVVDWNHRWKYDQSGALPDPNWFATNYNDTVWPSGLGALGFPSGENLLNQVGVNTVLNINDPSSVQIITYYFRTTFVLPTTNNIISVTASNLIDDGAVIYLNGREFRRLAMAPAPAAITYTNIATRQDDISAHGMEGYVIALTNLVVGTNYLAVEVHQGNVTGSSDAIMAMKVVANFPVPGAPPVITAHPQDREVDVGQSAQFSVTATGTAPLTYRWYSNTVLVATTSAGTHTTPVFDDLSADGATYYVTVSNRLGIVTSSNALLRVLERGPILTNAVTAAGNRVALTFHEPLAPGPHTNLTNYAILVLGSTNRVAFTNVTPSGASGVQLTLRSNEMINPNLDYVVCAYNQQDARSNIMAQSCIGIGFAITNSIIRFGEGWIYSYGSGPPPANWTQINFVPDMNFWGDGVATFWQDQNSPYPACGSLPPGANPIAISTTYYFRRTFNIPTGQARDLPLRMRYLVDDGAVFYLNGAEFHRVNMPQGPVGHTTLAASAAEPNCNASLTTNLSSLLRAGANALAVSVHQTVDQGPVENDITFDVEMSFVSQDRPLMPQLVVTRPTPTALRLSWTTNAPGWVFQSAPSLSGPWTNTTPVAFSGGTNRHDTAIDPLQPTRFFRLKNPQ